MFGEEMLDIHSKTCIISAKGTVEILAGTKDAVGNSSIIMYSQGGVVILGDKSTIIGKKGQMFGIAYGGKVEGMPDPENIKSKSFFTNLSEAVTVYDKMTPTDFLMTFRKDTNFTDIKFLFPPSSWYKLTNKDVFPQTMLQLEEASFPGMHNLIKWKEEPVNKTYPYPGAEQATSYLTTTIKNLTKQKNNELVNKATGLVTENPPAALLNLFTNYTVNI